MLLRGLTVLFFVLPALLLADDGGGTRTSDRPDERLVRLYAPSSLVETGLFKFVLPRFSLKTQVKVQVIDAPDQANLIIGDRAEAMPSDGVALFEGLGQTWRMALSTPEHSGTEKLASWLRSQVGQRAILGFAPEGAALFAPPREEAESQVEVALEGNAELGHKVSREKCTRCHAVDDATRGWGIGSTPSFGVLRALPDWEERFSIFFVLNPHPAFTQITDVTDPFPEDRPSPIAPVVMELDELEALLAYVAALEAADLGKPLDHQ